MNNDCSCAYSPITGEFLPHYRMAESFRGTGLLWNFNPHNGFRREAYDVESDPYGKYLPDIFIIATSARVALESKSTNPKDAIGTRKAPISVVPSGVIFDVGLAMLEGAGKYGRHNYRAAGVRSSVYYDAAMGHLMDWWEGQDIDEDSGLSHVTKALASLFVLRDAMQQEMLTDDRPPRSKVSKRDFNANAGAIIDRHTDKKPRHYTIEDTKK